MKAPSDPPREPAAQTDTAGVPSDPADPADSPQRAALLSRLIEAVSSGGIGTRSLRDLAGAAGTSHRMLIHHFGSADGVRLAIVREVEARQAAALQTLPDDGLEATRQFWTHLADPSMWPFERLFFECYARGAQGEHPFDELHPEAVDGWLAVAQAHPGAGDAAHIRLGLAVVRGLLLDLVATGDRAGVDGAMHAWLELLGGAMRHSSSNHTSGGRAR